MGIRFQREGFDFLYTKLILIFCSCGAMVESGALVLGSAVLADGLVTSETGKIGLVHDAESAVLELT